MSIASPNTAPAGVALELSGVMRRFPVDVQALDDVSISVAAGEFVSILGPSGCGKSTLLRIIAGLDRPTGGGIAMDGRGVNGSRRESIAYVFQEAHLLPWRNVLANVAIPLEFQGMPTTQRLEAARGAIEDVGLTDAITRYPAQLSGGMRMRVSLARALVTRPRLLLLDEPFAALDEINREYLDELLLRLWTQWGLTVIFVTHSVMEATFLSQRAIVLSKRPGRVVAEFQIDLPQPRTAELRTDERFARAMAGVHKALRGGNA